MAHWLKDRGFDAYAVTGGVAALDGDTVAAVEEARLGGEGAVERAAGRALAVLRYRSFRIYSIGVLVSLVGGAVEAAAFGYVVLLLGGSAATLGLIGFLNTVPNLVLGLPAGVLADRLDRRRLLLLLQTANLAVSAALAALWAGGSLTVTLLGALAVVGGSLGALSFPAFQGMLAATVPARALEGAVAVNSLSLQLARFLGPALAGVLLAAAGPAWVFGVNAASFLAVLAALALLGKVDRPARRQGQSGRARRAGWAALRAGGPARGAAAPEVPGASAAEGRQTLTSPGGIREALRYVFGQRSIATLMALMVVAGVFGTPPVTFMLPGIVRERLDGGGGTLGVLAAAIGLGAVLGSIVLLRLASRPNKGEPLLLGFILTGVAVALVGVSTVLPLSLLLAVVGGFAGVLFVGLSTVAVQADASDEMRARAMAIWAVAFVGMLPIGGLVTAGLAAWLGAGGAVTVDGAVVAVGGVAALVLRPEIRWLGCAALPEACVAATSPPAVAATEPVRRAA